MHKSGYIIPIVLLSLCNVSKGQSTNSKYNEQYRPQIHFSPQAKWMNDPNGLLFYNHIYHLFYQYYPDSTVWGPMHWGHATSRDLVHWQHKPIALYPDSLGWIFSGSAVADIKNTSGFGKTGKTPLVAIFTYHNSKEEKKGTNTFQTQGIAYSLDDGMTWTKYANNPVLYNPGIRDFRDPKVSWFEPSKKWIMTLATLDHISFYSSPDLKNWSKESEFGKAFGAHGGVWECPDLFPLYYKNQKIWILIVNINPGGPNGGSATQYFTGQFNGHSFTPYQTDTRWIDFGPDEYAGVTWSNTGNRKIFLGWMSNWDYATVVPTAAWRSAMTIPRELGIEKINDKVFVTSKPVYELKAINEKENILKNITVTDYNLTDKVGKLRGPARISINAVKLESFTITLFNDEGEKILAGYDEATNNYFIDRTHSGNTAFAENFAKRHTASRISHKSNFDITLIIDNASIELFADNGLSVMTEIFFPDSLLSNIRIASKNGLKIKSLKFNRIKQIWY
jgi:fructan beta-fructosidase